MQCDDKEAYTSEMLAYIFWHILTDSRQYFNTFAAKPRSNLSVLRESVCLCVVSAPMNCPIEQLIGSRNDKRGGKEEVDGHERENGGGSDKRQRQEKWAERILISSRNYRVKGKDAVN